MADTSEVASIQASSTAGGESSLLLLPTAASMTGSPKKYQHHHKRWGATSKSQDIGQVPDGEANVIAGASSGVVVVVSGGCGTSGSGAVVLSKGTKGKKATLEVPVAAAIGGHSMQDDKALKVLRLILHFDRIC